MKDSKYKEHFIKAPFGFAYNEIIVNDSGEPVDYKFIDVNPAFEKITGLNASEIVNRKASEVIPDIVKKNPEHIKNFGETALQGIEREFEFYYKKRKLWFNISTYSTENKFFSTILTDITDKKESEKSLRLDSILLKTFKDNFPNPIFAKDLKRRKILVNNADIENMGLKDSDSALGKTDFDIFPREIAEKFDADDREVIEKGKHIINNESKHILPSGEVRWYAGSKVPLYDENKKIIGLLGISHNVTIRKKAEEAIGQSEKKFRTLFEQMNDMVALHEVVYDESGKAIDYRILDCNPAFIKTTGIKYEEAVGRLASEVFQSNPPPYLEEYAKVAKTGEPYYFTTYYAPMDKHLKISAIYTQKNHFSTITADVTAIQQFNEMLVAKNKELENYLYVASHDLRSPLLNIQGFATRLKKATKKIKELIAGSQIKEDNAEKIEELIIQKIPSSLEYIFTNVTKMDSLIKSLLQISRTGRVKMTIQKINMNELIGEITNSLDFQLKELNAKIHLDNLVDCYGDKELLNQLFTNIVSNAIKYRNKNKTLIINIKSKVWYNKVIYSIEDNGIGISKPELDKIWDVFFRVGNAEEKGEGIGLSIAKRIVDKHKGKVWAISEFGQGSTFFIELPKNKFKE